jgi:two-component system response regulator CpxR
MRSAGRVMSRDEIAATLYHRESTPFERSIDVHVSHLRKKLETNKHVLIRTVRGVGYLFVPAAEEQPK